MRTKETQAARILRLMKEQGEVTNVELVRMHFLRYSARIMDLRREGHDILSIRAKGGVWRYVYRGESINVRVAS